MSDNISWLQKVFRGSSEGLQEVFKGSSEGLQRLFSVLTSSPAERQQQDVQSSVKTRCSPLQRTLLPLAQWWRPPCSSIPCSFIVLLLHLSMPVSPPSISPPHWLVWPCLTLLLSVFQSGPVWTGQGCQEEAPSGESADVLHIASLSTTAWVALLREV